MGNRAGCDRGVDVAADDQDLVLLADVVSVVVTENVDLLGGVMWGDVDQFDIVVDHWMADRRARYRENGDVGRVRGRLRVVVGVGVGVDVHVAVDQRGHVQAVADQWCRTRQWWGATVDLEPEVRGQRHGDVVGDLAGQCAGSPNPGFLARVDGQFRIGDGTPVETGRGNVDVDQRTGCTTGTVVGDLHHRIGDVDRVEGISGGPDGRSAAKGVSAKPGSRGQATAVLGRGIHHEPVTGNSGTATGNGQSVGLGQSVKVDVRAGSQVDDTGVVGVVSVRGDPQQRITVQEHVGLVVVQRCH